MRLKSFLSCLVVWLGLAGVMHAGEGGFIATLSEQEQDAAGLTRLSAEQQLALNTYVAREVSLARQGGVTAFAGTFSSRRKPAERAAAGLDQLSPKEIEALNLAVANAIASKPVPLTSVRRLREKELAERRKAEVHGRVTVAYGRGPWGRDFMAGEVYTEVYYPESGVALGVGFSEVRGDGLWWPDDYGYYGDARGSLAPVTYFGARGFRGGRGGPICGRH